MFPICHWVKSDLFISQHGRAFSPVPVTAYCPLPCSPGLSFSAVSAGVTASFSWVLRLCCWVLGGGRDCHGVPSPSRAAITLFPWAWGTLTEGKTEMLGLENYPQSFAGRLCVPLPVCVKVWEPWGLLITLAKNVCATCPPNHGCLVPLLIRKTLSARKPNSLYSPLCHE